MEDESHSPDALIEELGGCGRYQITLSVLVHFIKTMVSFSFAAMFIAARTPTWRCISGNDLDTGSHSNTTVISSNAIKACTFQNKTCTEFEFESGINTLSSEFGLVCDRAFIPSTVMSIQMAGVFFGNFFAGQLADLVGRKRPLFASILILLGANILGFFSVNWIMFAAARLLVGIGAGFFLSVQYSLLCEFTLASWRSWVIGFPSYPIHFCVFALIAWLIHDWRYIQLVCAAVCFLNLFTWWFIPESFRWYYAHDKTEKANVILQSVAEYNKKPNINISALSNVKIGNIPVSDRRYTLLDIFKSKKLIKLTLLLSVCWFAQGFVTYGIGFGIQALAGNIYLNLFLFSITGIPAKTFGSWLQNKIGRRKCALVCYLVVGIGCLIVGVVQYIDTVHRDAITNAFAIIANMGIGTAWGPVQTMTIELYPTVIRAIGFGSLSTMARVGAVLGPQLVYVEQTVPGIMYFTCAVVSACCVSCLAGLRETKDAYLDDKIKQIKQKVENEKPMKSITTC